MQSDWTWKRHALVIGIILALFGLTAIIMSRTPSRDTAPAPTPAALHPAAPDLGGTSRSPGPLSLGGGSGWGFWLLGLKG